MSRDCPERRQSRGYQNLHLGLPQMSGKEGIANAALVETEDIYPEGKSGKIGMEINANMVDSTFDGCYR